ncbi:hypothetical protein MKX01_029232 [Papaver californicum]|nr:hypothetical protein MKX01_029232 [Papaver californicum]
MVPVCQSRSRRWKSVSIPSTSVNSMERYDYAGYGQSSRKPSEHNTYADVEAVHKCLEESYGAKQENIILYGQSSSSSFATINSRCSPQSNIIRLKSHAIKEAGLDVNGFLTVGVSAALRQLLEFGLFHGDQHPGNVFVMRGGRIDYVDFGNVAQLSQRSQAMTSTSSMQKTTIELCLPRRMIKP